MRWLLVAILLGCSGGGLAYYRFQSQHAGKTDTFEDPIRVIARIMESKGQKVQDLENIPRAKIVVTNNATFDFGTMSRHGKKSHVFVLKNTGNAPSKLKVKKSSCKCTIGQLSKETLGPGEEAEIELTWSAETDQVDFGQSATIETEDPTQPEIQLTINGKVQDRVYAEPLAVVFNTVSSTDNPKFQFHVFSDFETPLELSNLRWGHKPSKDFVKWDYRVSEVNKREFPDVDARYVAELNVEFLPGMPKGAIATDLYYETNVSMDKSGRPRLFRIGFEGQIESQIKVIAGSNFNDSNSVLEIGKFKSAQGKIVKFLIAISDEAPEKVQLEVDSLHPDGPLQARIGSPSIRDKKAIFPVELEVPKGTSPVSYSGSNPSNFGRVNFRTNLEFSKYMPVYLRFEVEE